MFYKKKGIPEDSELVICTVKKILPHSVFVSLDEYENKEAMIHISEISPGRIRNIRDFVREGKIIVCKVLRIHEEKGHIDLSLRRVSIQLRKRKEEEYKQEQKAEKLIESILKKDKITIEDFYSRLGHEILKEYNSFANFFNLVLSNSKELNDFKTEKTILDKLKKGIKEKIKLPEFRVESILSISTKEPAGIKKIKETFRKAQDFAKQKKYKIDISYISSPRYKMKATAGSYKNAEKQLEEVSDFIKKTAESNKCEVEWQKKS